MDIKKNSKVDLQRYRTLFLLIGMVVSLSAMLIAFESPTKELVIQDLTIDGEQGVIIDLAPITQPDPPKPKIASPVILTPVLVITEEPQTFTNLPLFEEGDPNSNNPILLFYESTKETEVIENIPVAALKNPPTFGKNGTLDDFRHWINENLKYPELAVDGTLQGRVHMQFTVNYLGKVVDVKVLRGVDPLLDEEAVRVIKMSPDWTPGTHNGKRVNVLYNIPVVFRLN